MEAKINSIQQTLKQLEKLMNIQIGQLNMQPNIVQPSNNYRKMSYLGGDDV